MIKHRNNLILVAACSFVLSSCSVIEKASIHGLQSGYYTADYDSLKGRKVYLDVYDDAIAGYTESDNELSSAPDFVISMVEPASPGLCPTRFTKKSLDIDITSILFKYRFEAPGLPAQLNTDFNAALFAGWRKDYYLVQCTTNPLNNRSCDIINRGFDFGVFAGTGTTLVSPFTTRNLFADEYNGMILQFGIAVFTETNVASIGLATGFDHLVSSDRDIWIYNKKPWIGLIVGIALN